MSLKPSGAGCITRPCPRSLGWGWGYQMKKSHSPTLNLHDPTSPDPVSLSQAGPELPAHNYFHALQLPK